MIVLRSILVLCATVLGGNLIKHYGDFDLGLNKYRINQAGPIKQFLG